MKINTFVNNLAVPLQQCRVAVCNLHGSEGHNRWLSWLILCISLGLGLVFSSDIQAGNRKGSCGGLDQRPCTAAPTFLGGDGIVPSCDSGLAEDFIKGKCVDDKIGKAVTGGAEEVANAVVPLVDSAGQSAGNCIGGVDKCAAEIRKAYFAGTTAVTNISEPILRDVEKKVNQGVDEARKLGEKLLKEGLEPLAKEVWNQFSSPFISLANAVTQVVTSQEIADLGKAIGDGDGPAIDRSLERILDQLAKNHGWRDAIAHFKSKGFGSILFVPSKGAGKVVFATAYGGVAVDIDYVDYFIRKHNGESVSYDYDAKGNGLVIGSLITAGGFQIGPAAGGGVDINVGYHIAEPHKTGGPSIDVGISAKAGVGGGIGVGFDASKFPPQNNIATIAPGVGLEIKFPAIGPSFTFIVGQLCHDGKVVAGGAEFGCPKRGTGTGTGPGTGTGISPALATALNCVSKYAQANTCDWNHWTEMFNACKTWTVPELNDNNFLLNEVKAGRCTWNNWTNLYNQAVGKTTATASNDLSGTYRIRIKANNLFWHEDGCCSKLVSTRWQPNDNHTRFILEKQSDGSYRIKSKGSNLYLHVDTSSDKILSTRYQVNDDYTRFFLEKQSDGSYRIKLKATNRYLHHDGNVDKMVSTRYQVNDDFTRFFLDREL